MTGKSEHSGVIYSVNRSLSKILPEQTIIFRNRSGERELTLSPLGRIFGYIGAGLAVGWLVVATSATVSGFLDSDSAQLQNETIQDAYEARLVELAIERDNFARQAQATQDKFNLALVQITTQQDDLILAMTVQNEQQITMFALQRELNRAITERNAAQQNLDGLQAEFAALTEGSGPRDSSETELVNTLVTLNNALSETVEQRDIATVEISSLEEKIALTEQQIRLDAQRRDRMISQVEDAVQLSLGPLENSLNRTGMDVDSLLVTIRRNYSGSGGLNPTALSSPDLEGLDATDLRLQLLMEQLDTVQLYNIAISKLPLAMPVRTAVRFTSPFGIRDGRPHNGMDLAGPVGTPIYATADGYVSFAGRQSGYGNLIIIQHEFGFETRFGHLNLISVEKGQRVSRGDRIGDMGNTGRSTGSHLHYEVHTNGTPVNPSQYIKAGQDVY